MKQTRLAILGSTRGTDMQAIINAIEAGRLDAKIEIVLSNKPDAYILERAKKHNVPTVYISMLKNEPPSVILSEAKNPLNQSSVMPSLRDPSVALGLPQDDKERKRKKLREEFDAEVMSILEKYPIDLILLIGWMRILSAPFVKKYYHKIINVHPSLLPAFAGGMDTNVHKEVLKSGVKETGCTVHFVDEGVDSGEIVLQKKCLVEPSETLESLKNKVQKLEGEALIEVIKNWNELK